MVRSTGQKGSTRSLGSSGGVVAKINATARPERALARNRNHRRVGKNRRGLYRYSFGAGRIKGWRSLRPRSATCLALRTRAGFQVRSFAKTEATLRRQDHPRHKVPTGLSIYNYLALGAN